MILDNLLEFSTDQVVTADAISEDVFDANVARLLFGGFSNAYKLVIYCSAKSGTITAFTAGLVGADNAALTTNQIAIGPPISHAAIAAGSYYQLLIPAQSAAKRFYGINYTIAGTSPNVTLDARIEPTSQERLLT